MRHQFVLPEILIKQMQSCVKFMHDVWTVRIFQPAKNWLIIIDTHKYSTNDSTFSMEIVKIPISMKFEVKNQ